MATSDKPRFIVVGGGLAGLMTVIKIAEAGHDVDVFSFVPCRRSHSVCAQGGINGAVNTKGEGDSPEIHFVDTVKGGDFLAHQPPVRAMCYAAPGVIYLLDRMGVPFSRTTEGYIDFRRFGGTLHHRTAFAGATTGQQLLYALDEQVRRHEVAGRVRRFERHEFVHAVLDDHGRCRGIVAMDLASMKLEAFPATAVALATGGPGIVYGKSTNSVVNTGTAAALVYQQGALYANGEFIQVHPTAIAGPDKLRLISESLRGEGARVWVPKKEGDTRNPLNIPESERWYFLEEKYPKYKNLVPRDIASREIFKVVRHNKLGIGGKDAVYLDIVNPDKDVSQGRGPVEIARRVEGVVEIYERFIGDDPRQVPMQVFPAVHYSMGGLWVDYEHMTNIPGLFAVGEVDYQYHGANRLGANSLISCLYGGMVCGPKMVAYAQTGDVRALSAPPSSLFDGALKNMDELYFAKIAKMDGGENPYALWWELGKMMNTYVTVERNNQDLKMVDGKLQEMMQRWQKVSVLDSGKTANQAIMFVRQLWNMLCLARVITIGALMRDESRGSHYKAEFPDRNDEKYMKSTIAKYNANGHGPDISYQDIDVSLVKPVKRDYTGGGAPLAGKAAPAPETPRPQNVATPAPRR